jgi:hypothetical protein
MPPSVPVRLAVNVSVAVIDCVPAVCSNRLRARRLQGGAESMHPGVGGSERVVGGQQLLRIAAGEMDRAGVVGRRRAIGVLGRDREVRSRPRRRGRRKAANPEAAGLGLRGPIRGVEQHRDGVGRWVGNGQVRPAVLVEVAHRRRTGNAAWERGAIIGGEAASAVADQDVDIAVVLGGGSGGAGIVSRIIGVAPPKAGSPRSPRDIGIGRHREVELAILVEVPHRQGARSLCARSLGRQDIIKSGLEGAIAVAQENADSLAAVVRRDNVESAIVVQISDCHRYGRAVNGVVLGGRESAVPVTWQDADGIETGLGYRQVEVAVALEVSHCDRSGNAVWESGAIIAGEAASAVADQHVDVAVVLGGCARDVVSRVIPVVVPGGVRPGSPRGVGIGRDREVEFAILGEVPHRQGARNLRARSLGRQDIIEGGPEGAIAVAQQDADSPVAVVRRDNIELAIVGKISDRHRYGGAAHGVVLGSAEGAVALAQEHANQAAIMVGHHHVGNSAAGEVPHRHGLRVGAHREARRGQEARQGAIFQRLEEQPAEGPACRSSALGA